MTDRSGGLPRLSLLRTVLATFTAYGSSTLKASNECYPVTENVTFALLSSDDPTFHMDERKESRAHPKGFICFLKLKILPQISCNRAPDKIQPAFTVGQILNPYLPHYKIAFAFFILLYLHSIVLSSPRAYLCASGTNQAYHVPL